MPSNGTARIIVYLYIDLKESLNRVEGIIKEELPGIQARFCEEAGYNIELKYRGVQAIEENGIKLSFAVYCKGMDYSWMRRLLNRELLLMCERNEIMLAMPQHLRCIQKMVILPLSLWRQ